MKPIEVPRNPPPITSESQWLLVSTRQVQNTLVRLHSRHKADFPLSLRDNGGFARAAGDVAASGNDVSNPSVVPMKQETVGMVLLTSNLATSIHDGVMKLACRFDPMTLRSAALLRHAVLITTCGATAASAQTARDSVPLRDRVRISGNVGISRVTVGTPSNHFWNWRTSASVQSFVSEHWQLGIAPAVGGNFGSPTFASRTVGGSTLLADYGVATPFGTRAFAGASVTGNVGSNDPAFYSGEWHVGFMRFITPALAMRAQWTSLDWSHPVPPSHVHQLSITLDNYVDRRAGPMTALPGWGTTEVSGAATAQFSRRGNQQQTISLGAAPFITSWLQLGTQTMFFRAKTGQAVITTQSLQGSARLYAPLSPRLAPFIEGYRISRSASGLAVVSNYGGSAGARHWFQRGLALDAGESVDIHHTATI